MSETTAAQSSVDGYRAQDRPLRVELECRASNHPPICARDESGLQMIEDPVHGQAVLLKQSKDGRAVSGSRRLDWRQWRQPHARSGRDVGGRISVARVAPVSAAVTRL